MSYNHLNILHIDDDKKFLQRTEMLLKPKEYYSFKGVTNGEEAIKLLKLHYFHYDIILLDLKLPDIDGIEILMLIRKINPKIPVIFVSAHFGEPKWEQKLKKLVIKVKRIEKPFPLNTSIDFLDIENMIETESKNYQKERFNPFKFSLDEFMNLPDDEIDSAFEVAFTINSTFVEDFFKQNPDKDWVTFAKEPGNIIATGINKNEPFEEDLMLLAKEHDAPVFTYTRPKIIEEIDAGWSQKAPDDYYPIVTLGFHSDENPQSIKGDFDTGSSHSFFSLEELYERGILKRKRVFQSHSGTIWGMRYKYYREQLKCMLLGKFLEKEIILKYDLVINWGKSPFISNFKDRVALVGRNLLLENKVKLLLDGENKITDIIS